MAAATTRVVATGNLKNVTVAAKKQNMDAKNTAAPMKNMWPMKKKMWSLTTK